MLSLRVYGLGEVIALVEQSFIQETVKSSSIYSVRKLAEAAERTGYTKESLTR
jgi:hypothetical protein